MHSISPKKSRKAVQATENVCRKQQSPFLPGGRTGSKSGRLPGQNTASRESRPRGGRVAEVRGFKTQAQGLWEKKLKPLALQAFFCSQSGIPGDQSKGEMSCQRAGCHSRTCGGGEVERDGTPCLRGGALRSPCKSEQGEAGWLERNMMVEGEWLSLSC